MTTMNYEDYYAVRLVAYTQPNSEFLIDESIKLDDVQELIAFCARVSNPENQINKENSENLIKYLIKHQHWSPLAMADAVLEIDTTRDIGRQIIRHASMLPQEFSQRYQSLNEEEERGMKFVLREARSQDPKNRQNSHDNLSEDIKSEWKRRQLEVIELVKQHYSWALTNNIAKECARVILPEGNTTSRLYIKGSMRSWIHYIQLRSGNGTQLEHVLVARECASAISKIFPMINTIGE